MGSFDFLTVQGLLLLQAEGQTSAPSQAQSSYCSHISRYHTFKDSNAGLGHDDFHDQRAGSWQNEELQQAVEMNPGVTTQEYPESEIEELDFNVPFSFHFLGFLLPDLQTVVASTLLFPVPHFLGIDSTELALAPICGDTGAHSHEPSL